MINTNELLLKISPFENIENEFNILQKGQTHLVRSRRSTVLSMSLVIALVFLA
jgi:hypothetical protein